MGVKLVSSGGGSVEINPPATASSFTATMPARTGTVMLDGPAFIASAGTVATAIGTNQITLTESVDTDNCFASSTFTPTVAGLYLITLQVATNLPAATGAGAAIYKNGASVAGQYADAVSGIGSVHSVSILLSMNGTTDNVKAYSYFGTSGYSITSAGFQGYLVRAT